MDAGVLVGSPFYRDNEVAWSWVALEAWNFSRTFAVDDAELLAGPSTIELDGVDGAATVRVNGEVVGAPHSAFVTWRFALRAGLLRAGANNVSVDFEPPREYALRQNASYANGSYEVPSSIYYHTWSEPSARNFLRKPPFSFGWDWGPSFMPSGITGGVRITSAAAPPRLDELAVRQTHEPSGAVVVGVRGLLAPREPAGAAAAAPAAVRFELCHPDCATADAASIVVASGWATAPAAPGADRAARRRRPSSASSVRGFGGRAATAGSRCTSCARGSTAATTARGCRGAWGCAPCASCRTPPPRPPPATRQGPPSISRGGGDDGAR